MSGIAAASASGAFAPTIGALEHMQNRGRAGSGIGGAEVSGEPVTLWEYGPADKVFTETLKDQLGNMAVDAAIGHTLNPTHPEAVLQPIKTARVMIAMNGALTRRDALENLLRPYGLAVEHMDDAELVGQALDHEVRQGFSLAQAIGRQYSNIIGSYSCVALAPGKKQTEVLGFRDPLGSHPLELGELATGTMLASESSAFPGAGARHIRSVKAGELVILNGHQIESVQLAEANPKIDMFELIYYAQEESVLFNVTVRKIRQAMAQQLAEECGVLPKNCLVTAAPNTALVYGKALAATQGLDYQDAITKNPGIERSSMQPTQEARDEVRRKKYRLNEKIIAGRIVYLTDDSVVRGNSTEDLTADLRKAGAKEVHILIASPPVRYPNITGMDKTRQEQLAAATKTMEQLRKDIGCDSIRFLSIEGMLDAVSRVTNMPRESFDVSCFDGNYPMPISAGYRARLREPASYEYAA